MTGGGGEKGPAAIAAARPPDSGGRMGSRARAPGGSPRPGVEGARMWELTKMAGKLYGSRR
jgi:hypothetical protein